MKCQKCRLREATLHATQYVDGKECSVHLCLPCALSAGFDPSNPMSIGAILKALPASSTLLGRAFATSPAGDAARCPACGTTIEEACATGKLGCPACYEAFRATVSRALGLERKGRKPFRGKIPPLADRAEERAARRDRLARLLREAVAAERFEEAARLRDELSAMEKPLPGGEG